MASQRGKRLKWNTVSSLIFQVTTIVCGFILPRLILTSYGSEVNGLVISVSQFLHVIAFLELGVGAVVQSSLYKPLADRDDAAISRIIRSASNFFGKIALILLAYIAVLVAVYPFLVERSFGFFYTATLILSIGISYFAQYYFGVVDSLLLSADQRGYIQYTAQTLTLIINTLACALLIYAGASIQLVKLTTSCIYLLRPIYLRYYVNRHYNIDRRIPLTEEPIKQKWNGIAQHVAAVVLDQTDVLVLTGLSTLSNVSIYSVYHLVIYGVKNLFLSLTNGFQALIGEMLAKDEIEELKVFFARVEWLLHTGTTFVFGCTGVLVIPFVTLYTRGVTDADYVVPLFAVLITLAHAGHCLRLPYNILILAAGHYKQTQANYIVAAVMNVVISVLMVKLWGLVGVAIGTLCAMLYQTVWMAVYDSRHILNIPLKGFARHMAVDAMSAVIGSLLTFKIPMFSQSYLGWFVLAVIVALIWAAVIVAVNLLFYREELSYYSRKLTGRLLRRRGQKHVGGEADR